MIDTTQLTQLISAFRVETEKESISPETVGSLLQNITDLLANASSTTEQQIFENWKAILSQLNLVEDIGIGVEGVESVNIAISLRDLANGGHSARLFNIPSATPLRAGVMTAQQATLTHLRLLFVLLVTSSLHVAAAMALAAGMVQVAAIKKQQQQSASEGYAKGGFTKPGAVDEVAGVVHAGEWVASQKLLASPVARPLIEALDYTQRTNTICSLRGSDVSRSITAPQVLAQSQPQVIIQENTELRETIKQLKERLDEPFVTVNTVTGDLGIKQAQDSYQRLMNNKSPKNKRK